MYNCVNKKTMWLKIDLDESVEFFKTSTTAMCTLETILTV